VVTATITAEKGPEGIRVRRSHLQAVVEGLEGVDASSLGEIGRTVERECTISTAIRGSVEISYDIVSAQGQLIAGVATGGRWPEERVLQFPKMPDELVRFRDLRFWWSGCREHHSQPIDRSRLQFGQLLQLAPFQAREVLHASPPVMSSGRSLVAPSHCESAPDIFPLQGGATTPPTNHAPSALCCRGFAGQTWTGHRGDDAMAEHRAQAVGPNVARDSHGCKGIVGWCDPS